MWCILHHLVGHSGREQVHPDVSGEATPLEILKRRFALSEISREQFEEMVRVLGVVNNDAVHTHHQEY